jgi:hypothetical protein
MNHIIVVSQVTPPAIKSICPISFLLSAYSGLINVSLALTLLDLSRKRENPKLIMYFANLSFATKGNFYPRLYLLSETPLSATNESIKDCIGLDFELMAVPYKQAINELLVKFKKLSSDDLFLGEYLFIMINKQALSLSYLRYLFGFPMI